MTVSHYSIQPGSAFFFTETGMHTVSSDHPQFDRIVFELVDGGDPTDLVDVASQINKAFKHGRVKVEDGALTLDGKELEDESLADFVVRLVESGDDDPVPFIAYVESLDRNESTRSRTQLFSFQRLHGIELYPDGRLRLYKNVTRDYEDWHTQSVDNSVGATPPPFSRRDVDDDPGHACSKGYHAGSFEFARTFHTDGRLVAVAVWPEHVVSVPHDANCAKVRVTEYEVVEDVTDQAQKFAPVYRQDTYEYLVVVRGEADCGGRLTKTYRLRAFDDENAADEAVREAVGDEDFYSGDEDDFEVLSAKIVGGDDFGGQSEAEPEADLEPETSRYRVVLRTLGEGLSGYVTREYELEAEGEGDAEDKALDLLCTSLDVSSLDVETVSLTKL